jgi:hypothetical protein
VKLFFKHYHPKVADLLRNIFIIPIYLYHEKLQLPAHVAVVIKEMG